MESQPALRMTPESYRAEIVEVAQDTASAASRPFVDTLQQARAVTSDLQALAGRVREQKAQRRRLATAGVLGVIGGVLLWLALVQLLPWRAGNRLAALPLGGSPWQAGLALMRRENPGAFDRTVRLYNACADQTTEQCEAALVARITPPSPSVAASPRSASHGNRAGQPAQ